MRVIYVHKYIGSLFIQIYIYIYIYICYQSKVFALPQKSLFFILKELFLMKQIKHYNGFIL